MRSVAPRYPPLLSAEICSRVASLQMGLVKALSERRLEYASIHYTSEAQADESATSLIHHLLLITKLIVL